jgi:hypothetical protein
MVRYANSVEVSLFASFKLAEIDVESAACLAKEARLSEEASSDVHVSHGRAEESSQANIYHGLSLASLNRCAACYDAEIDSLRSSFESGSDLDVQQQHVKSTVVQWKFLCGQISFGVACKEYENMFHYRQKVYGNSHCHVSTVMF